MENRIWLGLLFMILPGYLLWRSHKKVLAEEKARSSSPFSEKLLRPPGETLRLQILELRDKIEDHGMLMAMFIVGPSLLVMLTPLPTLTEQLIGFLSIPAIGYALAIIQWRKTEKLRNELRNRQLGYDGERYVAAELNQLMKHGYHVFHDFLVDTVPGGEQTNFNIDHILIGPGGIFAIETKAWRKPNKPLPKGESKWSYKVEGDTLIRSDGERKTKAIPQAIKNAEALSKHLTLSSKPVEVTYVLILPGWWVTPSQIPVISGKNCASHFTNLPPCEISEINLQKIAKRIEKDCRNVEGA